MFISFDCLVLVLVIYIALLSHLACCAGEIPNVYGCRGSVGVLWYHGLLLMVSNLELCNYSNSRWGCMILDAHFYPPSSIVIH